jgi:predicted ester cyclase
MKFFKKKNKTLSKQEEAPRQQQQQRQASIQTTVVKYVGENKHVTTTTTNELGRHTSQTHVIKLTPEEMEELGIVPKTTTPAPAPTLDTHHHNNHDHEEQSMAGYSMAGYSMGSFSDVLPPPSFQDAAKKQNLKEPTALYQPPKNMMESPLNEGSSGSSSSQSSEDEDSHEAEQRQRQQQQHEQLSRQQVQERREEEDRRQQEYHQKQREQQLKELSAVTSPNPAPESAASPFDGSPSTPSSEAEEYLAAVETTRELVKKFISEIWNRGEVELIPKVCHPSLRFNGHVGMDRVGHEGFARMVTTVREALSEYHCEIHSMVVESTKAFCRLRFTGKHTGNLLGYPPTGKTVAWMGASEFTCKNGKILKVWELGDLKSLEEQLRSDT